MGVLKQIRESINKMFARSQAKQDFGVKEVINGSMISEIDKWANIYRGYPDWLDPEDNIKTIKFAKSVCAETSRLTTLALGIQFDGKRGEYMQQFTDMYIMPKLRNWTEWACAVGTVILKPTGEGIDILPPWQFLVTDYDDTGIKGIVFPETYTVKDKHYTKLEYHRFEEEEGRRVYRISNKTYISPSKGKIGDPIDISETKWAGLQEETYITKTNETPLDSMLFGVFKMPGANDIDPECPLGLSLFSDAIVELEDLDVAYSRNSKEIYDSQRTVLLDDILLDKSPKAMVRPNKLKLPKFVRNVLGTDDSKPFYQEINPTLNTQTRLDGLNALLSLVGYKCGYSNGYFVFNQKTGMITATQVESDDRRTIQLIKDIRTALEECIRDTIYAQSVFADLYGFAPVGDYEINFDFGDITYSYEEDRQNWWKYVQSGKMPFWRYLVKFEGFSEEDAKAIEEEQNREYDGGLFGEE